MKIRLRKVYFAGSWNWVIPIEEIRVPNIKNVFFMYDDCDRVKVADAAYGYPIMSFRNFHDARREARDRIASSSDQHIHQWIRNRLIDHGVLYREGTWR
jgi:hypothetical protein